MELWVIKQSALTANTLYFSVIQEVFDGSHQDLSPVHELPTRAKRGPLPTNTSDDVFFSPVRTSRPKGDGPHEERKSVSEEFDQIQPTTALQHVRC